MDAIIKFIISVALIFAVGWGVVWFWGALSDAAERANESNRQQANYLQSIALTEDEKIEQATKCTEAGLMVHYDTKWHQGVTYTTGVRCGVSVAQTAADSGMTTGEGVAAGAAMVGGAYIIGELLK